MQNRNYNNQAIPSSSSKPLHASADETLRPNSSLRGTSPRPVSKSSARGSKDSLVRVFNTALVSAHKVDRRDFSSELSALTESASFKAILNAVRQLSCVQGVSERTAAEELIETFRKLDNVWKDYILREGLDRIRSSSSSK
jgi:hypothetical protein